MYRCGIVKLNSRARFSTVCLHAGQAPDPTTGAIITPIYQTSTYVQDALGKHKGYEYARTQNPTREALERNIAAIEGGVQGFAFASGMAAIGAITTLLKAGAAALAKRRNARLVVDNTFASPAVQRPIEFGADIVIHSTTKYLNGHSDSVGGVVVAMNADDIEWLRFVQNAEGAILSPFDSW